MGTRKQKRLWLDHWQSHCSGLRAEHLGGLGRKRLRKSLRPKRHQATNGRNPQIKRRVFLERLAIAIEGQKKITHIRCVLGYRAKWRKLKRRRGRRFNPRANTLGEQGARFQGRIRKFGRAHNAGRLLFVASDLCDLLGHHPHSFIQMCQFILLRTRSSHHTFKHFVNN